jgi:hypothetical protein
VTYNLAALLSQQLQQVQLFGWQWNTFFFTEQALVSVKNIRPEQQDRFVRHRRAALLTNPGRALHWQGN